MKLYNWLKSKKSLLLNDISLSRYKIYFWSSTHVEQRTILQKGQSHGKGLVFKFESFVQSFRVQNSMHRVKTEAQVSLQKCLFNDFNNEECASIYFISHSETIAPESFATFFMQTNFNKLDQFIFSFVGNSWWELAEKEKEKKRKTDVRLHRSVFRHGSFAAVGNGQLKTYLIDEKIDEEVTAVPMA